MSVFARLASPVMEKASSQLHSFFIHSNDLRYCYRGRFLIENWGLCCSQRGFRTFAEQKAFDKISSERVCSNCQKLLPKKKFTKTQWKINVHRSRCMKCVKWSRSTTDGTDGDPILSRRKRKFYHEWHSEDPFYIPPYQKDEGILPPEEFFR